MFPLMQSLFASITIYLLGSMVTIILFTVSISLFLGILLPKKFARFQASSLLENQMQKDRCDVVYNFTSIKYCIAINENNKILDKQYAKLTFGIILEIIAIILCIMLVFFKFIIL